MELSELKLRLEMDPEDTKQDALLTIQLADVVDYVQAYCKQDFINEEGLLVLPPAVKRGITKVFKASKSHKGNVQSESIAGMSRTYFSSEEYAVAHGDLKPFRKVVFH